MHENELCFVLPLHIENKKYNFEGNVYDNDIVFDVISDHIWQCTPFDIPGRCKTIIYHNLHQLYSMYIHVPDIKGCRIVKTTMIGSDSNVGE